MVLLYNDLIIYGLCITNLIVKEYKIVYNIGVKLDKRSLI